jgi:hypothetical protein
MASPSDIEIQARLAKGEKLEDILAPTPKRKTPAQIMAEAQRAGTLAVEDPIHARCPCGQEFVVGSVEGHPVVLHAAPQCKDFMERDLPDYLHWVNVKQGAHN